MEIRQGRIYRAKKPAQVAYGDVNDRQVVWVSVLGDRLQYDAPSVNFGGKYKECSMEAFIKWAGSDVTGLLPEGDWMKWREYKGGA